MKLRELVSYLERCETWKKPNVNLEQYPTPPDIAAHMLLAAEAEGDLGDDRLVADLGCGGGVLGIGAAMLGAEHVLCVDIDPKALEVAAENVEELEVPVDLLACDVLKLAGRRQRPAASAKAAKIASAASATTSAAAKTPLPAAGAAVAAGAGSSNKPRVLPTSFIQSSLPTRVEFEASLSLGDVERALLEAASESAASGGGGGGGSGGRGLPSQQEDEQTLQQSQLEPPQPPRPQDGEVESGHVGGGTFDCVLMNPPFGTQKNSNGVDMAFLRAGLQLCSRRGAVYSLHKTSTR